ncbi:MAG: LysR family transcriptional regulator [Deltaproteobacteria bacterium]|nr:LysR family transcriptional regulator [Deltaproteobacteria bacterium]
MNPAHLRTFLAAAESLSFTKAGRRLGLSQPAVSRQVAQLEHEVQTPLFERLGRGLYLTAAGRALVVDARALLAGYERLLEAVRARHGGASARLRVGASTTPGLYLLPGVLAELRRRHAGIDCQLVIDNSDAVVMKLVANELDLGVMGVRPGSHGLRARAVAKDEIVCVAAADHGLARLSDIAVAALQGETWIVREPGSATRKAWDHWCRARRLRPQRVIEVRCPEAVRQLVGTGVGISFISTMALASHGEDGGLAVLSVPKLRASRSLYLVRHVDKHVTPAMQVFSEILARAPAEVAAR